MKKIGLVSLVAVGLLFAGCSSNQGNATNTDKNASTNTQNTVESSSSANSTTDSGAKTGTSINSEIVVTAEEALTAYEEAYPNTSVTSLDLDTSFGSYHYDVKGVDDSTEYEIKVNAKTGEVTKEREEKLDREDQNGVERNNEALDLDGILTVDQAAAIALETAGQGEAVEWSLERDLTTTYWEVKIKNGFSETSIKMDAKTGTVLETELDD